MARDPREGLTPSVVRAVLLHLVAMSRDSRKRVKSEGLLYVTFNDVKCLAAAERWLDEFEIKNAELGQEIADLKKRNRALIEDLKKADRGQK